MADTNFGSGSISNTTRVESTTEVHQRPRETRILRHFTGSNEIEVVESNVLCKPVE
jgi:hypothetical protein